MPTTDLNTDTNITTSGDFKLTLVILRKSACSFGIKLLTRKFAYVKVGGSNGAMDFMMSSFLSRSLFRTSLTIATF
jgi:hypothetical protein